MFQTTMEKRLSIRASAALIGVHHKRLERLCLAHGIGKRKPNMIPPSTLLDDADMERCRELLKTAPKRGRPRRFGPWPRPVAEAKQ